MSTATIAPIDSLTQNSVPSSTLDRHIMRTYARQPVILVRGEGLYAWDETGKRYMDLLGGIAVNAIGHCHPAVVQAVQTQAATLMHTSNLFHTHPQNQLADALIRTTGGKFDRIFFSNSGAEANEAALKVARKFGKLSGNPNKTKVVTALNSFHGRTFGTLTATGQPKYQEPFAPLVPDFAYIDYNDLDSLQDAVDENTCAVMLEPIQGEGGIIPALPKFLIYARALCDRFGALLIFDEIQTGMGRTGDWWAWQGYDVVPDVFTTAKALGGGMPIGATIARGPAADALVPGDHGSTFAGNAVCCAAAVATIETIKRDNLITNAARMGDSLRRQITHRLEAHVDTVRGTGLMLGVALKQPIAKQVVAAALDHGLIINAIGDKTLRLLPPYIITQDQVDEAVDTLVTIFDKVSAAS